MCIVVGCKIVLDNVIIKPAQTLSTLSNGPDSGPMNSRIYIQEPKEPYHRVCKMQNLKQTVFFADTHIFGLVL